MDTSEILRRIKDESTKSIFGFMYGSPYITAVYRDGSIRKERQEIIEIKKEDIEIGRSNDCFIYIWGGPGPDFNIYEFSDYGKTWAFSKKEIETHKEEQPIENENHA